jgi:hypothetical protein
MGSSNRSMKTFSCSIRYEKKLPEFEDLLDGVSSMRSSNRNMRNFRWSIRYERSYRSMRTLSWSKRIFSWSMRV